MLTKGTVFSAGIAAGIFACSLSPMLMGGVQKKGSGKKTTPPATTTLTPASLKQTLVGMGYDVNDLGNGSMEVKTVTGNMTVFVVAQFSKSGQKLWLTVNLGDLSDEDQANAPKLLSILRKNADIQPAQFYVYHNTNLRFGSPIENRGLTPATMRAALESVTETVYATKDLWTAKPIAKKSGPSAPLSNP